MHPTTEALIVIDIQNDFCPGGALAVARGDEILAQANALMSEFPVVVLTQDWHPANHSSFAANHADAAAFSMCEMPYGPQTLWPVHCVQGSKGAEFHPGLRTDLAQMVLRKGFHPEIDSYSGFFENDHKTPTGLDGYLRSRGVTAITLVGLATDFCVGYSALDAARLGYDVVVLTKACRAIDLNGTLAMMRASAIKAGVNWQE
ncbi:MAG: bifunctional nicotinamidase/pyrazinamidase [Cypionkella sp.]